MKTGELTEQKARLAEERSGKKSQFRKVSRNWQKKSNATYIMSRIIKQKNKNKFICIAEGVFQRMREWSILGMNSAISGKRQEMDSDILSHSNMEIRYCI